jgi:hypothetical protein
MSHASTVIDGHTVTITGPDADTLAARLAPATTPTQNVSKLAKARVTTLHECNAYLGHATGVLLAGDIECIVITADRESAQAFMDQFNTKPGDARFSAPIAMVQRKDVTITQPTQEQP